MGVGGTKEEREDASVEFGNHALTITLLGTFLARAEGGAGAKETAAMHLAEARRLIAETGYHRRDGELAELEALVG